MSRVLRGLALVALATAGGCGEDEPYVARCVKVDVECESPFEPTFDEIFARTLAPRCGLPGTGCHGAEGARDGLVLDEVEAAYDTLLGLSDRRSRVIPGEPSCSLVVTRLESIAPSLVMPPGDPLSAGERCAIVRWIYDGAQR